MYKVSETVIPIYINGQCPVIKTCSDVTLNLSSKDSSRDFGCLLTTFANSVDPDQDPKRLTLVIVFLKEYFEKVNIDKSQQTTTKVM